MRVRIVAVAVVVAATVAAGTAAAKTTALVNCGTVKAAGKTWHVNAAGVKCATARKVVGQVAVEKADHVVRARGGELDQYTSSFSGLQCFKSRKGKLGEIQCASANGGRNVIAIYRG